MAIVKLEFDQDDFTGSTPVNTIDSEQFRQEIIEQASTVSHLSNTPAFLDPGLSVQIEFDDNGTDFSVDAWYDLGAETVMDPADIAIVTGVVTAHTAEGPTDPDPGPEPPDSSVDNEPAGFPNRTDSAWTVTDGTRTFEISPTGADYTFYARGFGYTRSGAENVVWPDVEGIHIFYFDGSGALQTTQDVATLVDVILGNGAWIAAIYWDAANNVAIVEAEERHGFMPGDTHLHLHRTLGALLASGGALADFTVDDTGNSASHAQFSVGSTTIRDEDLEHVITDGSPQDLSPIANIPVYFRSGASGDWRRKTSDTFPLIHDGTAGFSGSGRAPYNEWTGATWQLTEVANNNFVLMHYFASNDVNEPLIGIQGQEEYATVNAARIGAEVELKNLSLGVLAGLLDESVALATVIFQTGNGYTNAPQARVRSVSTGDDYIDWREVALASASSGNVHAFGGSSHSADTLANANSKVSDAVLKTWGRRYNAWELGFTWSSDFPVSLSSFIAQDTNDPGVYVRRHDDSQEEGNSFEIDTPPSGWATNMKILQKSRAETAPGGASVVKTLLRWRENVDNTGWTSWSSPISLGDIDIPTNENVQWDEDERTVASWGYTEGARLQFQLTRTPTGDTLTGDWTLEEAGVEFS